LIWLSYIHYHLWQTGYRHIATIGALFLVQSIVGLLIGILCIGVRRVWTAVVGAGFALGTMAGFLISVAHGLSALSTHGRPRSHILPSWWR
jgi:hypothetical protein